MSVVRIHSVIHLFTSSSIQEANSGMRTTEIPGKTWGRIQTYLPSHGVQSRRKQPLGWTSRSPSVESHQEKQQERMSETVEQAFTAGPCLTQASHFSTVVGVCHRESHIAEIVTPGNFGLFPGFAAVQE